MKIQVISGRKHAWLQHKGPVPALLPVTILLILHSEWNSSPVCPLSRQCVCFVQRLYSILLTLFHWLSCPEWAMRDAGFLCQRYASITVWRKSSLLFRFAATRCNSQHEIRVVVSGLCALCKKNYRVLSTLNPPFSFSNDTTVVIFLFFVFVFHSLWSCVYFLQIMWLIHLFFFNIRVSEFLENDIISS